MLLHIPTDQYAFVEIEIDKLEDLKKAFISIRKTWNEAKEAEINNEIDALKEKHNSKLPLGNYSALSKTLYK